jgi:PAS domain S-box-containing protein
MNNNELTPVRPNSPPQKGHLALFVDEWVRLAMQTSDTYWWQLDLLTNQASYSPNAERILGHPPAPILQANLEYVHPDDRLKPAQAVEQAIQTGIDQFTYEVRSIAQPNQWRWFEVSGTILRDQQGQPARIVGQAQNITDRKRADQGLRQSEEQLALAIDIGGIGHWALNLATRELTTSLHCRRNFGRSEAIPFSYEELLTSIHPADRERQQRAVQEAINQKAGFQVEYRLITPQGAIRWVHIQGRYQTGDPPWLVGVSMNTTERKQAEEALREADRRKDEFLAMLAHELRNPLATLRSGLDMLKLTITQDELSAATVAMMNRQSNHLVRLVDELLEVSRINQGKIELQKEPLDLVELVQQAVQSLQGLFHQQGRNLQVELPQVPIYLQGDATRLSQVVTNLLTNGVRYTGEGGQLWLKLEQASHEARLQVGDNGIGLSVDQLEAVFELFVQVDNSPARSKGGLGLGLTLVKRLVEMHGGRVEAQSQGLGQGSTFTIHLPTLTEAAEPGAPTAPQATEPAAAQRILVIDDNADAAQMMAMLLRLKGYEAHTRASGRAGIEAAERLQPAAILLDIGMPELDGYSTCRLIREQVWGEAMVVIALTGYGHKEDQQRTREAGFDGHLVKPVDLAVLTKQLTDLLNKSKSL